MKTVEFYTNETVSRLEKKYRAWRTALLIVCGAALVFCIVAVALTRPTNVRYTRPAVLITSALAGSFAIYAGAFPVLGSKRAAQHAKTMLTDDREIISGAATPGARDFRIRGSVTVRPVTVKTEDGTENVRVDAELAKMIPSDGKARDYYVCHGYVVGYGEAEDEKIL